MQVVLFRKSSKFKERKFQSEPEFENLIIQNSKILFGDHSILIDSKRKIDSQFLGGTIPDCFLFDLSNPEDPQFYIVEVELAKHNFFGHIFPQITKFFAFFKNPKSQNELIEKLHSAVVSNHELKNEFSIRIGNKELFLYIKDCVENSQNILLIIDGEKEELPEIIETYTDTWGKMVKVLLLKEFQNNSESILSISPDFENIDAIDMVSPEPEKQKEARLYTVEYHLDGVSETVKEIFSQLSSELMNSIPNLKLNPQRYYVSLRKKRNFAYLRFQKKKVNIVVMMDYERTKERIHHHDIRELSEGVQNFYNGRCCKLFVKDKQHLDEVINLLVEIQK